MEATIEKVEMELIRIDGTEVLLEDFGPSKGQVTVRGYNQNYSYYWGAMGGSLKEFLTKTDQYYFASKLMGARSNDEMDVKKTFAAIRKWIREDNMKWFENMEFQNGMRQDMRRFQSSMEEFPDQQIFVDRWFRFAEDLDYYLIESEYDRKEFRSAMTNCEPWHFIETQPNRDYKFLLKLHGQLIKILKKTLKNNPS